MASPTTTSARAPEAEHSHAGVNEPSMEDILASIRRIIAEDQSNNLGRSGLGGLTRRVQSPTAAPAVEEAPAPESFEDVPQAQVLAEPEFHAGHEAAALHSPYDTAHDEIQTPAHEAISEEPLIASHAEPPDYESAAVFGTHEREPQPLIPEPRFTTALAEEAPEPLVSAATGASITSSFQTLAESVVLQDPDLIERVMRDSMRPLLKAWLDDHLPSIVERLVRTEIERVARGGRARNT